MSKYTTEVRYICETAAGLKESKGYGDVEKIIQDAIPSVFDFSYPIFDPSYRNVLETKILKHYYTREIGFETVGLWKLKLNTKLNEIMPFYNQLYESQLLKFNPLYDTDLMTTNEGQKDSNTTGEESRTSLTSAEGESSTGETTKTAGSTLSSGTGTAAGTEAANKTAAETGTEDSSSINDSTTISGKNYQDAESKTGESSSSAVRSANTTDTDSATKWDLYSATPQGGLTGVEDGDYLTDARKITDSDTKTGKTSETGVETGSTSDTGSRSGSSADTTVTTGGADASGSTTKTSLEADNRSTESTTADSKTELTAGESSRDGSSRESSSSSGLEAVSTANRFNSTESYVLHVVGKNAGSSYSKLLQEFRQTFLNIDLEVIEQLNDLFFGLW